MYNDLIKQLREYSSARKGEIADLTAQAADAIEELSQENERIGASLVEAAELVRKLRGKKEEADP